jgi:2-haloacid dehalogenase
VSPSKPERRRPIPVFDVGGVLLDWDPRHLYRKVFADEAAVEDFLARVCPPSWNRLLDAGVPFAEAVAARAAAFPDHEAAIRAYDERWQEMVAGPIPGAVACLRSLKSAGCALYAISNFSAEKFSLEQRRWDFLNLFDGVVLSADIGILKPDAGIYRYFCRTHGLEPGDCLFIDDRIENVAGARACGMAAHHYRSPEELENALQSWDLPSPGRG